MYHSLEKANALEVLEDKKYSYFSKKRSKEIKSLSEYKVNTLIGSEIYYFYTAITVVACLVWHVIFPKKQKIIGKIS